MAYKTAGTTTHYEIFYDDSLEQEYGLNRSSALRAKCEADFKLMAGWFVDVPFKWNLPIPIYIPNTIDIGGAHWDSNGNTISDLTLVMPQETSVDTLRWLVVAEMTEVFMRAFTNAYGGCWEAGSNEGSIGEGLSRFLAAQFSRFNGFVLPTTYLPFQVSKDWLNSIRLDYINSLTSDNAPDARTGCTTLFIYYLNYQLGFSIDSIIVSGKGATNLVDVYKKLTGDSDDPFPYFKQLLDYAYPPLKPIPGLNPDNPFPIRAALANQITVGRNADGRLELFYTRVDNNAIYHTVQVIPNIPDDWMNDITLELGDYAWSMVVANNKDGRQELFYIGTDSHIYHNWQTQSNGGWNGEASLGGSFADPAKAKQISVGTNQDGRLELFYVGTNNTLFHNWQQTNSGWSGENELGDSGKQIVAVSSNSGLVVFYIGMDNSIHYKLQSNNWNSHVLGGSNVKQITVTINNNGLFEIFYIDSNNIIYHNKQTSQTTWSGQSVFGGSKAMQLIVAQNSDERLELFYIGLNNTIYHNYQLRDYTSWSGEIALGGFAKQLSIARNMNGLLELFYIGTDNAIYYNYQTIQTLKNLNSWSGQTVLAPESAYTLV